MPPLARKQNEYPQDSFVAPPIAVFLSAPPSEIRIVIYTIFKKQGSKKYWQEVLFTRSLIIHPDSILVGDLVGI
jgi:uncharacterized membrane-anchored protein